MDSYMENKFKNRTLQFISRLRHICIRNIVLKFKMRFFVEIHEVAMIFRVMDK